MKAKMFQWSWSRLFTTLALLAALTPLGPGPLQAAPEEEEPPSAEVELTDPEDPDADEEPSLEETLGLVDDRAIETSFETALAELLEQEKTGDPKDLRIQMESRSRCKVDLPTPTVSFPLQPKDVYHVARSGVLCLGCIYKCDTCEHWHAHLAGGVLLSEDGVAVTNHHVLLREDAAAFGAMSEDGRVFPITEVLAASKEDDLAIVKFDVDAAIAPKTPETAESKDDDDGGSPLDREDDELTPAMLSIDDQVGTPVWAITHPDGHYYSLTTGVISRYYHTPKAKKGEHGPLRVAITADFARGSSGCGVFNDFGKLTGLVVSTRSIYYSHEDGEGRNLQMVFKDCAPARRILDLIEDPDDE